MTEASLADIHRIKGILRANNLHEGHCDSRDIRNWSRNEDGEWNAQPCNCWLSEDPFDMEKDPPVSIGGYQTADPDPKAERVRTHRYADGRKRSWVSERGGPWKEV